MNLIFQNQFYILSALFLIGAAVTGWFIFDIKKKIKILFGGKETEKEEEFVKDIVRRLTKTETKLEEIEPRLKIVEAISQISIQKTGFLRFNPFQDTGGDQSFIIALLDRGNNGIIISSLYTREGVRVYAKEINNGKPKQHLSDEEQKVLEETINKN